MTGADLDLAEVIDASPVSRFQAGVVTLCALVAGVEGFSTIGASFAGPALARAWSLPKSTLGLFFSAGLSGLMLGAFLLAPLADRVGRRPVLIGCPALFGLGGLAMAASPSLPFLFAAWFVTGLGIGGAMPNAIAATSEFAPRRIRSLMIVLAFSGFIVGSIIAGMVSARLIGAYGWRAVFLASGLLPLMLAPFVALFMPESLRFLLERGRVEAATAIMRRIAPAATPVDAVWRRGGFGAPRASLPELFRAGRRRNTALLWIVGFCSLLDLFLLSSWLPTEIVSLGVSLAGAILISVLLPVGGLCGVVLGLALDRFGPAKTLVFAYLVGGLATVCMALCGRNIPLLIGSVLCAGFGMLGGQTAANAAAAMAYPLPMRSTGVGWFFGVGRLGSIVGPALAGVLLSAGLSGRNLFLLSVIPILGAALASAGLRVGPAEARPARAVEAEASALVSSSRL